MRLYSLILVISIVNSILCQRDVPKLLLANQRDVRLISLQESNTTDVLANRLSQAVACDYIFADGLVFWIDTVDYKKSKIQCTNISNAERTKRDVFASSMEQPDGLACDWIGKKLYWTDAETKRIEVSELNGSHRKALIWLRLDQPRAIAVDPHHAFMYWTDWGEIPKIERAGMDGTQRQVLVNRNIYWPNGITLDYDENMVYWVEANFHAIYRMNADGSNRQLVINEDAVRSGLSLGVANLPPSSPNRSDILPSQSSNYNSDLPEKPKVLGALQHPFAIAQFGDRIYWSDWATDSIHSILKNGSGLPTVIKQHDVSPMDIQIYSSQRQTPGLNPCGSDNGGCSHLCLLSPYPHSYRCVCSTGVKINVDNKTCSDGPSEFLLLARRSDIRMISLDTTDYSDLLITASTVEHAIAIDFDPVDQFVYWTDSIQRAIFRARLNGSDLQAVVTTEVEQSDGIAIDWIGRNLYWTDTGRDYISVSRLDGKMRKVLIKTGIDEPRDIAVHPSEGLLYWSDWGFEAKIEVANLDGSDRRALVNSDIEWPNGLALDRVNHRLYWADAGKDRIEMIGLDGTGRTVVISKELPHVFGLSLLGNHLYWTDWQRRRIERMQLDRPHSRHLIKELPDVYDVTAASVRVPPGSNPCADDNGGCSHLCLYTPHGARCHCPNGLELTPTMKDCFVPEAYLLVSFSKNGGIGKSPLDTAHSNAPIPFKQQVEASFLDFSVQDDQIYWTDTKEMAIMRSYMNGTHVERYLDTGLDMLEGIAVDWIGRNVYWADSSTNRIEVARMDGKSRKLIMYRNIENPRSIAVDPERGYIYWSEWGRELRIMRADMDGGNVKQINKDTIGRANSLTIDHGAQRLYYVDFDLNAIVACGLDGYAVRDIVRGDASKSISSLTLYGEYVYWSDSKRHAVMRANKNTGNNEITVQSDLYGIDDVIIYHTSRQAGVTSCAKDNGGCEHLCLSLPSGQSECACPTHYTLAHNNRTCLAPSNFLLLSQTRYLARIIFQSQYHDGAIVPGRGRPNFRSRKNRPRPGPDAVLPVTGIQDACAVDYDPIGGKLYWIDCNTAEIKSSTPDGSETSILFRNNGTHYRPFDLAVDAYSKMLYWTEVTTNTIRLMKLDGRSIGVVSKEKVKGYGTKDVEIYPRKIAVDSFRGRLYFSNVCADSSSCRVKIMQSAVDGSDCIVVFHRGLRNVTALTLDGAMERLYWADQSKIETAHIDGSSRRTLIDTGLSMVVGLAVFGSDLFWIDSRTDGGLLEGAYKEDGSRRRKIQSRMKNLQDIVGVVSIEDHDNHPCSLDNGGCSHICVTKEDRTTWCSCPDHLVLTDHVKCAEPSTCDVTSFACKHNAQCIPLTWLCDGDEECNDGSDESDCPNLKALPLSCDGKFSCGFGDLVSLHPLLDTVTQCIEYDRVCDGNKDCLNGKDEKQCSVCKAGEISCRNSFCIPASLSCGDCKNGACLHGSPSASSNHAKEYIVPLAVVGAILGLLALLAVLKHCVSQNSNPYRNGVVMFTSDENGEFNVQFQSRDGASAARASIIGGRRKQPLFVSIGPTSAPNSAPSQTGTSRSGWPTHKNGRIAERPKLSGASCGSTMNRSSTSGFPTALESCAGDCCTSSDSASFHESCSGCKRSQRHRLYRKSTRHGAPPPTPCTTDTCEDAEKCSYRRVDAPLHPHEPPPPYDRPSCCCHYCHRCHVPSSAGSTSSRRHTNYGNPPSYERLGLSRRCFYHGSGMASDSDPYPPPPTPHSQYMSEGCDTTEVEDVHELETLTSRIDESEDRDDEETVLLAPSPRSSPSMTEMSFSLMYDPPPSPVSSR